MPQMATLRSVIALILVLTATTLKANSSFKISSYNIRNFAQIDGEDSNYKPIDGPTNPQALEKVIRESQSDIMAFQEIINAQLFERLLADILPSHRVVITECGGTADQKIALAYNEKIFQLERYEEEWRVALSTRCNYGLRPALVTWLKHRKSRKKIAVVVVHLKAGSGDRNRATRKEQHEVLKTILDDIEANQPHDVIILGDFNTTSYFEQTPGAAQFEKFLDSNKLKNTTSKVGCTSFWQGDRGDEKMWPSHLDHILHRGTSRVSYPKSLAHCALSRCSPSPLDQLGASFKGVSDHCPIQVQVKLSR